MPKEKYPYPLDACEETVEDENGFSIINIDPINEKAFWYFQGIKDGSLARKMRTEDDTEFHSDEYLKEYQRAYRLGEKKRSSKKHRGFARKTKY